MVDYVKIGCMVEIWIIPMICVIITTIIIRVDYLIPSFMVLIHIINVVISPINALQPIVGVMEMDILKKKPLISMDKGVGRVFHNALSRQINVPLPIVGVMGMDILKKKPLISMERGVGRVFHNALSRQINVLLQNARVMELGILKKKQLISMERCVGRVYHNKNIDLSIIDNQIKNNVIILNCSKNY